MLAWRLMSQGCVYADTCNNEGMPCTSGHLGVSEALRFVIDSLQIRCKRSYTLSVGSLDSHADALRTGQRDFQMKL